MSLKFDVPIPVLILHWNRPLECLKTVQAFLTQNIPLSISIIDNHSTIENFQILKENLPIDIELIRLEENKGWGGGFNTLLRRWITEQSSPYCIVSAHDALPQENCLQMLVTGIESDPRIGIVCPEYGKPELPHYSPIKGPSLITTTARIPATIESVSFAHQTLVMYRRECLQEIGLYDERYFAYGDEYEISLRAWRHQWKVALVWGAIVTNPGSWTPRPTLSYLLARNTLLLALTYGGLGQAILRAFFMGINTLRIVIYPTGHQTTFHPIARILGIRDFILGRYGAPSI